MSYHLPSERRLCLTRGWSYLGLAVGLFGLSFTFGEMDQTGRLCLYLFMGFWLLRSWYNFRRARKVSANAKGSPTI